jgi:hypothetical protein
MRTVPTHGLRNLPRAAAARSLVLKPIQKRRR